MIRSLASALAGRTVFVTGHTGFKGSWLSLWLARLGARVVGYALRPATSPNLFEAAGVRDVLAMHHEADIRDREALHNALCAASPDVVLHLAAQPLVRAGYQQPRETFDVNVGGTINVLESLRVLGKPCSVVVVTTDKCYENREHVWGYRECDALGGYDPYSASKAAAEVATASYRSSFFSPSQLSRHGIAVATARAGNVIGGGDWSADRIVTELVRAGSTGEVALLRNPRAVRPWQHVLEPVGGYLALAARMILEPNPRWCEAWNFGPLPGEELPVGALATRFFAAWGSGSWADVSRTDQPHEASILRLSIDKAVWQLGWRPQWNVEETVRRTARWYRGYYAGPRQAAQECVRDLVDFEQAWLREGTMWNTTDSDRGILKPNQAA
ncbi:MAG: CDP-glucose 4,6-dehydratase [Pirellulales bacterium]